MIALMLWGNFTLGAQKPDPREIIQKSVIANEADFQAASEFNYKERDRVGRGSKTYQVTMIDGSPYERLIAINGKPLSPAQQAEEQKKQEQAVAQRRSESSRQRQERIAKYEKDRKRDHEMMQQLTKAFDFTYVGRRQIRGFTVYMLKATPRRGYVPPNTESRVLTGMQGELWIDQKSYNWVRVTARVIRPVSIEGFLAEVEPGTEFEMEKSPVGGGIWQIAHFAMKSRARVLHMFNRASEQDNTYFDYQHVASAGKKQ